MRNYVKTKTVKFVAVFLLVNMVSNLILPLCTYALTSGPTTPEVQTFTPAGVTDMVDLFTGDFGYNLPLFELPGPNGGYPLNLSYHGGIAMDQEASWVGLGWNLNPGAVTRDVRGLPDDFDGDIVKYRHDMKENSTVGIRTSVDFEIAGADADKGTTSVSIGMSLYYNSYRGFGLSLEPGVGYHSTNSSGSSAGIGLNMSMDSQEGVGLNPQLSLGNNGKSEQDGNTSLSLGVGYNSKRGLTDLSYGFTQSVNTRSCFGSDGMKIGQHISFANTAYTPSIDMEMTGYNVSLSLKMGGAVYFGYINGMLGGYYTEQSVKDANQDIDRQAYGYMNAEKVGNETDGKVMDFNREKDGLVRDETPNLGIPSMTHDLYNISGQGISGSFRPYRPQVGLMFDPHTSSLIGGGSLGVEVGFPAPTGVKVGIDLSVNVSRTSADESGSSAITNGGFTKESFMNQDAYNNVKNYEPYYMKMSGEATTEPKSRYNYMKGADLVDISQGGLNFGDAITNYNRKPRNTSIQQYLNKDLNNSNCLPEITNTQFIDLGSTGSPYTKTIQREGHSSHIGGFEVLQPDGSRYVYGLPVYNKKQVDKQYSVNPLTASRTARPMDDTNDDLLPLSSEDQNYHKDPRKVGPDSQQFLNRTELPAYTTAHLVTCILGADYVDVDNNGPTDNDFGYWVKFNYKKTPLFNWKVPFRGASYSKGLLYPGKDDKASYVYGEKEVYYLSSAETKTHIVIFNTSKRRDATGVKSEYNEGTNPNSYLGTLSYKLDNIQLYSKSEPPVLEANTGNVDPSSTVKPISTTHFEYSYELCRDVPNFDPTVAHSLSSSASVLELDSLDGSGHYLTANNSSPDKLFGFGKLTLKKVWFTYEKNSRGALSPYQFHYDNNPNYEHKNQDRWGTYKAVNGLGLYDYPYAVQNANVANQNAKAWCLNTIETPSGSRIKVNYEADDYAYVQNKVAGQMFRIARTRITDKADADNYFGGMAKLYDPEHLDAGDHKKVYFDLQDESYDPSFSENASTGDKAQNRAILKKYIEDLITPDNTYQLYYKVKMDLRSQSEPLQEYISGYASFNPDNIGFDDKCIVGGHITRGYILLNMPTIGSTPRDYHPFSAAAWQFLRTNMSEYESSPGKLGTPAGQSMSIEDKALELVSSITSIRDIFTTYYGRAARQAWGSRIDLNHSWIRLSTPYKKKYGGGHRVSKITIESDWDVAYNGQTSPTQYGVTYDYTTKETSDVGNEISTTTYAQNSSDHTPVSTKRIVSSGVAQYEPSVGGDEISLRFARGYPENIPLKTANNLYFEYPINESYFPSPTVGYSKVTVRSLATDNQLKHLPALSGVSGTGETVHEFYTARDFPVITDMTPIDIDPLHVYVPIPFIGECKFDQMKAHQGYKIELNDMHGKPKSVTYYAQDKEGKIITGTPVSSVRYDYKVGPYTMQNQHIAHQLSSTVSVMTGEGERVAETGADSDHELGVEYDCFMDIRHSATRSGSGGVGVNMDFAIVGAFPVAVTIPWPSISYSQTELDMGVTNKIIRRTGILTRTTANDGESKVVTDNLYYDAQTGRPVLTSVTNAFDQPVYKYSIPAHWIYDGMGAAYRNFGIRADGQISRGFRPSTVIPGGKPIGGFTFPVEELADINLSDVGKYAYFVEGDEIAVKPTTLSTHIFKGTVIRKVAPSTLECVIRNDDPNSITFPGSGSEGVSISVIRSGRRNMLNTDAGVITALEDPTERTAANQIHSTPIPTVLNSLYAMNYDINSREKIEIPQQLVDLLNTSITQAQAYLGTTPLTTSRLESCPNNTNSVVAFFFYHFTHNLDGTFSITIQPPGSTSPSVLIQDARNLKGWFDENFPGTVYFTFSSCSPLCDGNCTFNISFSTFDAENTTLSSATNDCCGFFGGVSLLNSNTPAINDANHCDHRITSYNLSDDHYHLILNYDGASPLNSKALYKNRYNDKGIADRYCYLSEVITPRCSPDIYTDSLYRVISATAVRYSDTWMQDFTQYRPTPLVNDMNKYITGEKGIWRPSETYTYVESRGSNRDMDLDHLTASNSNSNTIVNLKKDGTFGAMPMFQWAFAEFAELFPKWRLTNTITDYNPYGYEVENKDILNNYSAALYGYNGKLSIGVVSNSRKDESGFEGFEEYNTGAATVNVNNIKYTQSTTGNFTFLNDFEGVGNVMYKKYKIAFAFANAAVIDMDYDAFISEYGSKSDGNVVIHASADATGSCPAENVISVSPENVISKGEYNSSPHPVIEFIGAGTGLYQNLPSFQCSAASNTRDNYSSGRCWSGYLYLPVKVDKPSKVDNITFTNSKAHSGKMSMKVSGSVILPQLDLKLQAGKKYILEGWVSSSATNSISSAGLDQVIEAAGWGIKVGFGGINNPPSNLTTTTAGYVRVVPKGRQVEGWRRIEAEITVPATLSDKDVMYIQVSPFTLGSNSIDIFLDDLRIHPFDANMKSYVYDPKNYKLRAELDNNNYATFYSYDAQGNLFQIKRETEEGILTVQESRSHIKQQ